MPKVNKREYLSAICTLVFNPNEFEYVRQEALAHLFCVAKEITEYRDTRPVLPGKNLPLSAIKGMVGLAYQAILKKIGRDDPHTMGIFNAAIQHLSEHELRMEWESIVDGTVSNIVETMMNFENQPETVKQDIANIFEGLARPYFVQYKGKVPKEDLEWAHTQLKEYFQDLKRTQPLLKGGSSRQPLLPGKKSEGKRKSLADIIDDIKKVFKLKENKEWIVYEIPAYKQTVNGLDTYQTFQHFCKDTKWEDSQEFWDQLEQAQKNVFIYVSKTKNTSDPLHKLATIDNVAYMDASDNLVTETSGLGFPSAQPELASEEKCTCDLYQMMREGCKCGHVDKLKEQDKFYTATVVKKIKPKHLNKKFKPT